MVRRLGLWLLTKGRKDERGVPEIRQYRQIGPLRLRFEYISLLAYVSVSLFALFNLIAHLGLNKGLVMALCILGMLLYSTVNGLILRERQRLQQLRRFDEVRVEIGADKDDLRRFACERGISPRMRINGEDFYDLSDFGDAGTLLRPSNPPEALLRPAASSETPGEQLLRPTSET